MLTLRGKRPQNSELVKFVDTIKKGELKGGKYFNVGNIWPSKYDVKENQFNDLKGKGRSFSRKGTMLEYNVWIPDERKILAPNKTYTLIIDYPLRNTYTQEIKSGKKGLVLREVLNIAVDAYKKIYKEEKKTSKLKEESIAERNKGKSGMKSRLLNRAPTDGIYGIWGHDLSDLTITNIIVKGNKIYLSVDS
jgi:hypothetical protein